jgi:ammonium transporter, Amt family
MVPADVAWMIVATALVLLMTPALAFFYGGLVRSKNALNTMMMSYVSLGVLGVTWAVIGYSLAFGTGGDWIGDLSFLALKDVGLGEAPAPSSGTIPHILFMAFQATFAIVTAALISGAIVERMRFGPYILFLVLWSIFVYSPVCHWVWAPSGWLFKMGALDYAGGTVVHVNAAVSAFVAAIVLGSRKDYARQAILPHNVPFVLLGAGLLWFGWFGFNAGSAIAAGSANGMFKSASLAFVTTMLAPAATLTMWSILDIARGGKATAVGAATAIVVGLVAITPAAGHVSPTSALIIGGVAAFPSYFAILYRAKTKLDDSLDVVAAHGVGGTVGALMTGLLAQKDWSGLVDGAVFNNPAQMQTQVIGLAAVIVYAALVTFVILKVMGAVMALRADVGDEGLGMDVTQHGEEAYTSGEGAILVLPDVEAPSVALQARLANEGGKA